MPRPEESLGSGSFGVFRTVRLAQDVTAAPDGFDVVGAAGSIGKFLAQLADEDVDDLQFRLVVPLRSESSSSI